MGSGTAHRFPDRPDDLGIVICSGYMKLDCQRSALMSIAPLAPRWLYILSVQQDRGTLWSRTAKTVDAAMLKHVNIYELWQLKTVARESH